MSAANLRLVIAIAREYDSPALDLLDLIQEGNLGLLTAIDRFDVTRGHRLGTYATWWIRQRIRRALTEQTRVIRVPAEGIDIAHRLREIAGRVLHERGRDATVDELARAAGVSAERVNHILRAVRYPVTLDRSLDGRSRGRLADVLRDPHAEIAGARLPRCVLRERIDEVLTTLSYQEREVLRLRYGLGNHPVCTLDQTGRLLRISRERVRQIEMKALGKLRHPVRRRRLEDFFEAVNDA
jgi:RNA polymerase primary sigma factor